MIDRFIGVLIILISLVLCEVVDSEDVWKDLVEQPYVQALVEASTEAVIVPPPAELGFLDPASSLVDDFYLWVAWDANTEPDLAGYKIHYGRVSGDYIYIIDVASTPMGLTEECLFLGDAVIVPPSAELGSLDPASSYDPFKVECCEYRIDIASTSPGLYYFAATAYDEEGNESSYSDELMHYFHKHVPKVTAPTDMQLHKNEY